MKLVQVYKSRRKADTYLYMEKGAAFEELPEALQKVFGEPEPVLLISVTKDKQLARYSGEEVLAQLADKGFLLQLPPGDEKLNQC